MDLSSVRLGFSEIFEKISKKVTQKCYNSALPFVIKPFVALAKLSSRLVLIYFTVTPAKNNSQLLTKLLKITLKLYKDLCVIVVV